MLHNLSIKYKLAISPLVSLAGFGIFLAFVVNVSLSNIERVDSIRDSAVPLVNLTSRNLELLNQLEGQFSTAVTTGETDLIDAATTTLNVIAGNFADIKRANAQVGPGTSDLESALREYFTESAQLSRDMIAGALPIAEISARAKLKQQHLDALQRQLIEQKNLADNGFNSVIENANSAARRAIYVGTALGILLIITLLAISISISISLTRSVKNVSDSLRDIAQGEGDLTKRVQQQGNDEIGEMVRWFNVFIDKLQSAVSAVIAVSTPLAHAGERLNQVAEISA